MRIKNLKNGGGRNAITDYMKTVRYNSIADRYSFSAMNLKTLAKVCLVLFMLSTAATGNVAAQDGTDNIDNLDTGISILIVGVFGILTLTTIYLSSPIALMGWASSFLGVSLYLLGLGSLRLMYLIFTIHAFTLAATGVFDTI